jgi:ribosomal protein S12 methylthiotransferase accessory factor
MDAARQIAIAEAAERYSAGDFLGEPFIWSARSALDGPALDLDLVPRCSAREYALPQCPLRPPDLEAKIRWVRGISMSSGEELWIPAIMSCYRLHDVQPEEKFWHQVSTGYAVHSNPAEALVRAACEIIERDSIALTWLQRLPLPRLTAMPADGASAAACCQSDLADLLDWADRHFLRIHLFDATTDLGVATVYCVQIAEHDDDVHQVVGCATSRDIASAARKAVLETILVRRTLVGAGKPPLSPQDFTSITDGGHYMAVGERAHAFGFLLEQDGGRPATKVSALPTEPDAALAELINRLREQGIDMYAVERTPAEVAKIGLTAVSVIIPQLQPTSFHPFARFLGHPRLRQAPAAMGLRVLTEEDMNPWPQPFI